MLMSIKAVMKRNHERVLRLACLLLYSQSYCLNTSASKAYIFRDVVFIFAFIV